MKRRPTFLISVMVFGFAFFYIPILSMIVYSFNASRLATVWGGFSTKWYVALFTNCLLYTSPSPRDRQKSRMPSSA